MSGVWKLEISVTRPYSQEQQEGQEVEFARYVAQVAWLLPSGTRAKLLPWLLEEGCTQENFSVQIYSSSILKCDRSNLFLAKNKKCTWCKLLTKGFSDVLFSSSLLCVCVW